MDIATRIKELRTSLDMTQEEFASRIGITRNSVANYETRARTPVAAIFSLICREFNVNETWLRYGKGKMFDIKNEEISLDDFANQQGITELEKGILEAYLLMDKKTRALFMARLNEVFIKHQNSIDQDDIESKVAAYRAELEAEKKTEVKSSASQDTA